MWTGSEMMASREGIVVLVTTTYWSIKTLSKCNRILDSTTDNNTSTVEDYRVLSV